MWITKSIQSVATFYGVAERTVKTWLADGMPRQSTGGRRFEYDLSAIAQWRHDRDLLHTRTDTPDGTSAKDRKTLAQAEKYEIEVQKLKDQLVDVDAFKGDLRRQLRTIARSFQAKAEAIEQEFGREVGDRVRAMVVEVSESVEKVKVNMGRGGR